MAIKKTNHLLYFDDTGKDIIDGMRELYEGKGIYLTNEQLADIVCSQYRFGVEVMKQGTNMDSSSYARGFKLEGIGTIRYNSLALMSRFFGGATIVPNELKQEYYTIYRHLLKNGWRFSIWTSTHGFEFVNMETYEKYRLGLYKARNMLQASIVLYEELASRHRISVNDECDNIAMG